MPVFTPISTAADLPRPGTRCEGFTFDFKAKHTTKGRAVWECAKDVAAFANHLGGTLLVGIPEVDGVVGPHQPLAPEDANTALKDYGNAQDLCHPPPVVNVETLQVPAGTIVAVNVWPYPAQVVGVRLSEGISKDFGGRSYVFPLRAANRTVFIQPENLPMYMSPEVRRIVILLNAIPDKAGVIVADTANAAELRQRTTTFEGPPIVDEMQNTVSLATSNPGIAPWLLCLDKIETVFALSPERWAVVYRT